MHRLVYLRNEILKCQTSICCTVQLILYYLDVKPVHMHLFVNYLVAKLIYIYLFLLFMCCINIRGLKLSISCILDISFNFTNKCISIL
jgi:hypothetical protein